MKKGAKKPKTKNEGYRLQPGDQIAKKELPSDLWEQVNKLLNIGCTGEEIAQVQGVSYDTLSRRCEEEQGMLFAEYIKRHNSDFKISLRRAQFRASQGVPKYEAYTNPDGTVIVDKNGQVQQRIVGWLTPPNITMQIWLGKQHLGQVDKHEVSLPPDTDISLDLGRKLPGEKGTTDAM